MACCACAKAGAKVAVHLLTTIGYPPQEDPALPFAPSGVSLPQARVCYKRLRSLANALRKDMRKAVAGCGHELSGDVVGR